MCANGAPKVRIQGSGLDASLVTKPIRIVLKWQAIATVMVAVVAAIWVTVASDTGTALAAAWSAVLGGCINLAAVTVYGLVLALSRPATPAATVVALFRAEAGKILVIVVALWLVLTTYSDIVPAAFFGAFVVTVLMFRMAFLDRN
jgi:F0F1-type ATP synthase assembly protein I